MSRITLLLLGLILPATVLAETLYDPTRPPQARSRPAVSAQASPLTLSSVIHAADRRLARINGRWVGEGDWISGARVLAISEGRVSLARGGERIELVVARSGIRKRPADPAS